MNNKAKFPNELVSGVLEQIVEADSPTKSLNNSDNPVIKRALERLKASQNKENPYSGFKNHGSHNTHSTSTW